MKRFTPSDRRGLMAELPLAQLTLPPLSRKAEIAMFERYQAGDAKAAELLVRHNLGLCISAASEYYIVGIDEEDLLGFAICGLYTAITKFDPKRGCKFSTMATPWIWSFVGRELAQRPYGDGIHYNKGCTKDGLAQSHERLHPALQNRMRIESMTTSDNAEDRDAIELPVTDFEEGYETCLASGYEVSLTPRQRRYARELMSGNIVPGEHPSTRLAIRKALRESA